jgi:hypothetical protein
VTVLEAQTWVFWMFVGLLLLLVVIAMKGGN